MFIIPHFVSYNFSACQVLILISVRFQARLQRGNILLKQGNTQEAREDFEAVVSFKFLNLLLCLLIFSQNNNMVLKVKSIFQLQRSPDHEEAHDQLMKANELEELQEEAHASYHQGDYSTAITMLERVIEVWHVRSATMPTNYRSLMKSSTYLGKIAFEYVFSNQIPPHH